MGGRINWAGLLVVGLRRHAPALSPSNSRRHVGENANTFTDNLARYAGAPNFVDTGTGDISNALRRAPGQTVEFLRSTNATGQAFNGLGNAIPWRLSDSMGACGRIAISSPLRCLSLRNAADASHSASILAIRQRANRVSTVTPEWAILHNWKVKNRKFPNRDNFKKRNIILRQFLAYFATLEDKHGKLQALKQIAWMDFPVSDKPIKQRMEVKRSKFNKHKDWKLDLEGSCVVCGARADVRHHIIQIQKGGTNGPQNLVLLCNLCHAEIHPWLKNNVRNRSNPSTPERRALE